MCLKQVCPDPYRIGFVSFTRAARREASTRAAKALGLSPSALEKDGWFKTLHSVAYRCLGVADGELLTGTAADNEWLKGAVNDAEACLGRADADDDNLWTSAHQGRVGFALALWDVARNRQSPIEEPWQRAKMMDNRTPALEVCEQVVELYEEAKRRDERMDFSDLLMTFSGRKWSGRHQEPFVDVPERGTIPLLPVWIHDEAQDMSELSARAFKRLVQDSDYVYLMGDDWQSIFGFAGSDGSIFSSWPVAKEECLPTSHRCRKNILDLANEMMHRAGLAPRAFAAEEDGGTVERTSIEEALAGVRAGEETLVLARTNDIAASAAKTLEDNLIPWKPIKGNGGFAAPARCAGVSCIIALRAGEYVDGEGLWRMLNLFPVKAEGTTLIGRGVKKWLADAENRESMRPVRLTDLAADVGVTEAFCTMIASGAYKDAIDVKARPMARAGELHGVVGIHDPQCRVGTMHGCKGLEADHVVAINRLPYPTVRAIKTTEGLDEERRLWYVTLTRARHQLTIGESGRGSEVFQEV